nr:coniferyl aldehyde dehydrogenase [Nonomuraea sp. SYSU D8015]
MTITEVTPQPTDAERFGHILAVQRAAYLRDGAPSPAARRSDLSRLKAALIARRNAIEEAINTDFGNRSRHETAMMELGGVVQGIDYLKRNLRRFMRPTRRHTALHMRFGTNRIEYQPLGVVGVISPWNYPVNLSLMPVVTAIAAGNRVMLKPSTFAPATNTVLASMLSELFPPEQVTIVSGDGSAFSSLPFDHLVFMGSTEVGRAVMKAASENLVPVTLELGGKSPTIVAKGHVRDRTVSDIVFGKLLSGGQTCIAPDYTSIINDKQYAILTDLIEDARSRGARIIEVGHRPGEAVHRPHTLAPTVVLGVTDEMRIAHEEIFGPILPIFPYRDIDDAIDYVNARRRPLALYYFGKDDTDRRKILDRTISGNVTVNGTIMHVGQDDLPFGGVGASGMGQYHGIEGFRTLSHPKGIFVQGRWNAARLLYAPLRQAYRRSSQLLPSITGGFRRQSLTRIEARRQVPPPSPSRRPCGSGREMASRKSGDIAPAKKNGHQSKAGHGPGVGWGPAALSTERSSRRRGCETALVHAGEERAPRHGHGRLVGGHEAGAVRRVGEARLELELGGDRPPGHRDDAGHRHALHGHVVRLLAGAGGGVDHDVRLVALPLCAERGLQHAAVGRDAADEEPSPAGGPYRFGEVGVEEGVERGLAFDHRLVAEHLEQFRVEGAGRLGRLAVGDHQTAAVELGGLCQADHVGDVVAQVVRAEQVGEADGVVDEDDRGVVRGQRFEVHHEPFRVT